MKNKYLLLATSHVEDGVLYKFTPGVKTIVESSKPLDVMFANKFKKLGVKKSSAETFKADSIVSPALAKNVPPLPDEDDDEDEIDEDEEINSETEDGETDEEQEEAPAKKVKKKKERPEEGVKKKKKKRT